MLDVTVAGAFGSVQAEPAGFVLDRLERGEMRKMQTEKAQGREGWI
jgi:hypothetical protein